ncbi:PHD finger protein 24 isoform X1 [Erpetoichthys calabaricus]|uniref:PHD finger protein 24 n=1 Tax=Erpetoichthys calabaricus TaxID=27687 RepID=A0A8C4SHI8_ERPCA|nr:PHD finger protein 24 isoform X1 [Erpetoichthys calabaricus]
MGVLMSKRQSVEKVQKVSVVVSAFKEGLKDKPAFACRPEHPNSTQEQNAIPTETKAQENDNESKQESSSSHFTAKDDAATAWSRLRDGRGLEPEEIQWAHQLTPPAFIRPKRKIDDDQPVDINLEEQEQLVNDEMCEICEVWTAEDLYPCRICTRVFHDGCLREMGYLHKKNLQHLTETAHTATGWSCYYCDNVNLLLTEEEMYNLMDTFKKCNIIPDSCLSSDEFLHYKHFVSKQHFGKQMSEEMEEQELRQFSALEQRGEIEWMDFLYHESLIVLKKFRSKNSSVRLLTAKERDRARDTFISLDTNGSGLITRTDFMKAQQTWFRKHTKGSQSCNGRLFGLCSPVWQLSSENIGKISAGSEMGSRCGETIEKSTLPSSDNTQVDWNTFISESAIFIVASRPNNAAIHLHPLL